MKAFTVILAATFFISAASSDAQSILWQAILPGVGVGDPNVNETGIDIVELADGDFLVLGEYGTPVTPQDSAHGVDLVRIGIDGTVRWQKRLSSDGRVFPVALFDEQGGSYAIVGWHEVSPEIEGDEHLWISRIDSSGTVRSTVIFTEFPLRVDRAALARGGGFVISGISDGRAGVARVDASFTPPWFRTFDLGAEPVVTSIKPAEETGHLLVVNTEVGTNVIPHVVRLNEEGDSLWTMTAMPNSTEFWYDIMPANNDGFIVTGTSARNRFGWMTITAFNAMRQQVWRFDEPIWIRGTDSIGINVPNRLEPTGFGNVMIVGRTGPDVTIPFLLEFNQVGDVVWKYIMGGPEFSASDGRAIAQLGDGGYIVVGQKYRNMLITRVSRFGTTGVEDAGGGARVLDLSFDEIVD